MDRTKIANYRRIYIAYLIANGVNTVPKIVTESGMPKRTVQQCIKTLTTLGIEVTHVGADRNGWYEIQSWGFIDSEYVTANIQTYSRTFEE